MQNEFDKKAYDAANQRKVYERFKLKREQVYATLGGKCEVCEKIPKHFHLHHKLYHAIESDYPRHSKAMNVRIKRVNEAEAHPERFSLLCAACHRLVSILQYFKVRSNRGLLERAISIS